MSRHLLSLRIDRDLHKSQVEIDAVRLCTDCAIAFYVGGDKPGPASFRVLRAMDVPGMGLVFRPLGGTVPITGQLSETLYVHVPVELTADQMAAIRGFQERDGHGGAI